MTASTVRPSVIVIQLVLPHYNVSFFNLLTKQWRGSLSIVAGRSYFGGSPLSQTLTPGLNRVDTDNCFLLNALAMQWPLPTAAYSADLVVLEFNPRVLSNLWVLFWRRLRGRGVVLWGHGLTRRKPSGRIVLLIRKLMARMADAVIFYSEQGKQEFVDLRVAESKLFVAYNSIDVQGARRAADEEGPQRRTEIIFVGRLVPAKKAGLLIDGFAQALDRLPTDVNLIIVGDGPENDRLKKLVERYGISGRVRFVGEVMDDRELAPYFARSSLCVCPGYIGLSVIHSFAFEVPILAADSEPHSPEVEALKAGFNCEYFKADDADSLSEKLVELMANPQRLQKMGDRGLQSVLEKYSFERMATVFMNVFDYVLDQKYNGRQARRTGLPQKIGQRGQ